MPTEVTDPELLNQLNGTGNEVTDPAILSQLNSSQPPQTYQNNIVLANGQRAPVGSPAAIAANSPTRGFWQNALEGAGETFYGLGLGAQERFAQLRDALTGSNTAAPIQQQVADNRAVDAPLNSTWGAKVGQVGALLPTAFLPGVNTYAGAAAMGTAFGALQPTTKDQSVLLNTGIGAATGVAGKYLGDQFSKWLSSRASQPFMGESSLTPAQLEAAQGGADLGMQLTPGQQAGSKALLQFEAKLRGQPASSGPFTAIDQANQGIGDAAAANSIGVNAPNVDKTVLRTASQRFSRIFGAARDPNISVNVGDSTLNAIDNAGQGLNSSTRGALNANSDVSDLTGALGGTMNAQNLGSISSNLGNEATRQMTSQGGDRALGKALFSVKEHVDDLIGTGITDPDLAAEYASARPQYRNYLNLTAGKITNPSTGTVNLNSLASRLMKKDRSGFMLGGNDSDLYKAATFGQAFLPVAGDSGTATREMGLGNLAMQVPAYLASRLYMPGGAMGLGSLTGPLLRAPIYAGKVAGGVASRALGPVAPYAAQGLQGLAYGAQSLALPYLEN